MKLDGKENIDRKTRREEKSRKAAQSCTEFL